MKKLLLKLCNSNLMKGFDKKYKNFPDFILKITKQIWENKDVNSIAQFYTDNIPVRSPFGVTYGNKPVIDATYATLKEFPNRQLLVKMLFGMEMMMWVIIHLIEF